MLPTFRLLAISDRATLAGPFESWLATLSDAGLAEITAVQIREKDLSDGALLDLARRARALWPRPARLLVNGRLDVALAAGADGAHLPGNGVPVAALRARFGPEVLLGQSTHSVAEIERARDEGADYVTYGPVYPTPGKGEPAGLEGLARAVAAVPGFPVYALGGVTLPRFEEIARTGAAGAAAIRLFQDPSVLFHLPAAAREPWKGCA